MTAITMDKMHFDYLHNMTQYNYMRRFHNQIQTDFMINVNDLPFFCKKPNLMTISLLYIFACCKKTNKKSLPEQPNKEYISISTE